MMVPILPFLGALAFGTLAFSCNSKSHASAPAKSPSVVLIPQPDPNLADEFEAPPKPIEKLCYSPKIQSAFYRHDIYKKSMDLKDTMDRIFQRSRQPGRAETRLVSDMSIKGRMPLSFPSRSSEEVFINFRTRLYDYDPDDFYTTMFFSLRVFQCDHQQCNDEDDSRLRAEILPEPLRIGHGKKVNDADQYWLQPFFDRNPQNPSKNDLNVVVGYEEGPLAMVTYEQSDISKCAQEEKELEKIIAEDPLD